MGNPKCNLYDPKKAADALASNLRDLCEGQEAIQALADYLGVTQNAVRQFRDGKSFPQPKNLVKIARFYNVSLDALIGLNEPLTPKVTIDAICEYTGLSRESVKALHEMNVAKESEEKRPLSFINRCFNRYAFVLARLDQYITSSNVRRRLDVKDVVPSDFESIEDFKRALAMEELHKKTIWIDSSDDMSEELSVGKFYRESKMTEIRSGLDKMREEYDDETA